ncbi:alpha/beta hydrolase fold domain-containing protein [Streptomyces sp. B3I7]|uniref:alpha/beta hydrolase fold domain-containing protein n=1 Tax=Streptomyces sp. B3I7 TaxID=3042269 RepID=UPI0027D82E5E|nr:alpha/beta hydrolase fold domain-containing protein [Streptomyces sp. B3I7]
MSFGPPWSPAQETAVDPERVLLVGFSGGGAVAAGLALRLRDENQLRPVGQMLVCPMLDDRNDTLSALQLAGSGGWNRATNEAAWRHVLGPRRGAPDVPACRMPPTAPPLCAACHAMPAAASSRAAG